MFMYSLPRRPDCGTKLYLAHLSVRGRSYAAEDSVPLPPHVQVPLNKELCTSMSDWNNLPEHWWGSKGGALQAVSVVDRVRRALGELSDVMTSNLQATAERLGNDLNEVADWQVQPRSHHFPPSTAAGTRRVAKLSSSASSWFWASLRLHNVTNPVIEEA